MEPEITPHTKFHLGYHPSLDGIRGVAVLWVMGFHYQLPMGRDGLFGVDIFFTLSGFLITVLLVEEWQQTGAINFKNFYIRRILRLYPALLLLLAVIFPITPRPYIYSTLFYFTNWIKAFHLQPDSLYLDHTWSLSIEEQFYFLWPIFLTIILRTNLSKKMIVFIPLGLGFVSALARIVTWISTHDWFRVYMGTDLHADGLLLGSAFGLMTAYRLLPDFSRKKSVLSLITLITFLLGVWLLIEKQLTQSFIPLWGNLGVSLGTLVIISRIINYRSEIINKIFSFPLLVKIGMISYGLYLWHAPIGEIIDQANFGLHPSFISASKVICTFLVASLSFWMVEKPLLRFKTRFISAPSKKEVQPINSINEEH